MYSFDTDIVIDFLRGEPEVVKKIDELTNKEAQIFITPIVLCELYEGAYKSKNSVENVKLVEDFLIRVNYLDFSALSCKSFGEVKTMLSKKGKPTQDFDLMIAAVTLSRNLTLVTRNRKHFENIPDLKIEVW